MSSSNEDSLTTMARSLLLSCALVQALESASSGTQMNNFFPNIQWMSGVPVGVRKLKQSCRVMRAGVIHAGVNQVVVLGFEGGVIGKIIPQTQAGTVMDAGIDGRPPRPGRRVGRWSGYGNR